MRSKNTKKKQSHAGFQLCAVRYGLSSSSCSWFIHWGCNPKGYEDSHRLKWNEYSVHLCAASKYRFHQDFTELRSLFRLFRTWSSAIVSGGRQSICQRGRRDGIWTWFCEPNGLPTSSDSFPRAWGFIFPDPRLHHLLFTLPYSSCTRLVRHLCYQSMLIIKYLALSIRFGVLNVQTVCVQT